MPQNGHSPSSTKTGSDDSSSHMVDQTDRKKKNADAQAAFRARRANYIATLEETVTNLEAVVIQLQESCRASKADADKLRSENLRLRNEARDREKFWRALWQTKKTGMPPDPTDDSALPSYAQSHSSSPVSAPNRMASVSPSHYDPRMRFADPAAAAVLGYNGGSPSDYPQRSPALDYSSVNGNAPIITRPPSVSGYAPYAPYTLEGSSPEDSWSQQGIPAPDQHTVDGSQSPTYVESPTLTSSELAYGSNQYGVVDDGKLANGTPYMYPASRSISPASTPTSTSSTSIAPVPYQFAFPEGPDFGYRRGMGQRELTLHGGTADIPIAGSVGDALRYRLTARSNTMPNPTGMSTPYSRADNNSGDRESDESEPAPSQHDPTLGRPRRSTAPATTTSSRTSRSPSPPPPISGTLAVIKAQAFGALRRSRGRSRRSSEGAAKAAVEALSARGLALGINLPAGSHSNPNKRPRLDDDNEDMLS